MHGGGGGLAMFEVNIKRNKKNKKAACMSVMNEVSDYLQWTVATKSRLDADPQGL